MATATKSGGSFFNPVRVLGWGAVGAILLAPVVAMRFTAEITWGPEDFLFAAILLIGAGLLLELIVWKARAPLARLTLAGVVSLAVLLVWAEAAVGIF